MNFTPQEMEAIRFSIDYAIEEHLFSEDPTMEIHLLNVYRTLATNESENLEEEMAVLYTTLKLVQALTDKNKNLSFLQFRQLQTLADSFESAIEKLATTYQFK